VVKIIEVDRIIKGVNEGEGEVIEEGEGGVKVEGGINEGIKESGVIIIDNLEFIEVVGAIREGDEIKFITFKEDIIIGGEIDRLRG
jgi:hypothetical protein